MKKIFICISCFLIAGKAFSQNEIDYNDPFNKYQKFSDDTLNVDSAYYCFKIMVADKRYTGLVATAVHDELALSFPLNAPSANDTAEFNNYKMHQVFAQQILARAVKDTSAVIQQLIAPLCLTINIQQHINNLEATQKLVKQFISQQLNGKDIHANSVGRYGLRVYQLIETEPGMEALKKELFTAIKTQLLAGQVTVTASTTRAEFERRSWYRWMYAYVNYIEASETKDTQAKEAFLKTAYNYSPDFYDKTYKADYYYDMVYLTGDDNKDNFQDYYFNFLLEKGIDKTTLLGMLRDMALLNPEYKSKLRHFYDSVNTTAAGFDAYWLNAIYKKSKDAPLINLVSYEGATVKSKQFNGKWVLVDFWGTWCPVCRWEHPDLQKFYDSTILKNSDKISLLTIAAKDTKEKVDAYMKEKKFSFPVAISDNKIENEYRVQGYPTKLLITPQGKYIEIPFGLDWQNFVKEYCDL